MSHVNMSCRKTQVLFLARAQIFLSQSEATLEWRLIVVLSHPDVNGMKNTLVDDLARAQIFLSQPD